MANERSDTPQAARPAGQPTIRWDVSDAKSSYANFSNVSSTREEFVLLFGMNQAWQTDQGEIPIQLTDRIILSPFVAKRLAILLTNVLREQESRVGSPGASAS